MEVEGAAAGASSIPGSAAAGEDDEEDFGLSSSAPGSDSRNCRLARKAESARQARLRHKQYVTDLQEQVRGLQMRIHELETQRNGGQGSASTAIRELKTALTPEQNAQLREWLTAAQGEQHVLARHENGTAAPPPSAPPTAPIAIGAGAGGSSRSRGAASSFSPMESDTDETIFPLSRSWNDCEVARSILYLNSPNGFHPLATGPNGLPPPLAPLPNASAHSSSLPSQSSMPSSYGSMLNPPQAHSSSLLKPPGQ